MAHRLSVSSLSAVRGPVGKQGLLRIRSQPPPSARGPGALAPDQEGPLHPGGLRPPLRWSSRASQRVALPPRHTGPGLVVRGALAVTVQKDCSRVCVWLQPSLSGGPALGGAHGRAALDLLCVQGSGHRLRRSLMRSQVGPGPGHRLWRPGSGFADPERRFHARTARERALTKQRPDPPTNGHSARDPVSVPGELGGRCALRRAPSERVTAQPTPPSPAGGEQGDMSLNGP